MLWSSLWIRICECLDRGIPKWRERIVSFGQVAAAESREKGKRFSDNEIFEGVVKAILSSNTDWAKIERLLPEIRSPFENFALDYYASLTPADVIAKIYPWLKTRGADSQNLKQDLVRLTDTSKQLLIYSEDHNGLHSFIAALVKENNSDPKQLALQFGSQTSRHKLRGMGVPLAAETLKNSGFDIGKPDRHVNRAMGCFGLVKFNRWSEWYTSREGKKKTRFVAVDEPPGGYSYPEPDEPKCFEVMKVTEEFAKSVNERPLFLDNAIWLLCARSGLYTTNEGLKRLAR